MTAADPRTAAWLARVLAAAPPVTPGQAATLRSILSPHAKAAPARLTEAAPQHAESQERNTSNAPATAR